MDDDKDPGVAADPEAGAPPRSVSLRFRARGTSGAGAALEANDDLERATVMLRLGEKSRKLLASEQALGIALERPQSDEQYRRIDLELDETRNERIYCDARFSAVNNGRAFSDPGPQEEAKLTDSINAVDRALQNTAALEALLTAVHGLVAAYPASSTE